MKTIKAGIIGTGFIGPAHVEAARQLVPQAERAVYYEAFLRQFDADLPALTLYQHVTNYVLSDAVQAAEIGRLQEPRDRFATLPAWFLSFREVPVNCPAATSTAGVTPAGD